MALIDDALENYILKVSEPEPALLREIHQATLLVTKAPQMLCGPVVGQLLHTLIKISGAKRCLEIGTFTGYSAHYIASALPPEGKLITCEKQIQNVELAQRFIAKASYAHKIEIKVGDALETLSLFSENSFDFIFLDADKNQYPRYYDLLVPLLKKGAIMIVDNTLWKGEVLNPQDQQAQAIDALNQKARLDRRVEKMLLSVRDGLLLLHKVT